MVKLNKLTIFASIYGSRASLKRIDINFEIHQIMLNKIIVNDIDMV